MGDQPFVSLSNGVHIPWDPQNMDIMFEEFIKLFLKPYYEHTNDWNNTLHVSIKEIEYLATIVHRPRDELIRGLLKKIETHLPLDIAELRGTDKIEILFLNIDDYVVDILKVIQEGQGQEATRQGVAQIVQDLNLFELSELIIHLAKGKHLNRH